MASALNADLVATEAYVVVQSNGGALDVEPLRAQLATSMQLRIAQLPVLTMAEGIQLGTTISNGNWSAAQSALLRQAVNDKVNGVAGANFTNVTTQNFRTFHNYLTQTDVDFCTDNNNSKEAKRDRCLKRLFQGGLYNPSERTCSHITASLMVLCGYDSNSTPQVMYDLVCEVKRQLEWPRGTTRTLPFIKEYPADPSHLPETLYKSMYPDTTDPPTAVQLVGVNRLVGIIPLRSNHRSLRASSAPQSALVSAAQGSPAQCANAMVQAFMQMMGGGGMAQPDAAGGMPQINYFPQNRGTGHAGRPMLGGMLPGAPPAPPSVEPDRAPAVSGLQPPTLGRARTVAFDDASATAPDVTAPSGSGGAHDSAPDGQLVEPPRAGASAVDGLISRAKEAFVDRAAVAAEAKMKAKAAAKKRPAAAGTHAAAPAAKLSRMEPPRPKMPNCKIAKQPPATKWFNGTVYVSKSKGCFRVIKAPGFEYRVDTPIKWSNFASLEQAWTAALDVISAAQAEIAAKG